jgi:hypothetical protein
VIVVDWVFTEEDTSVKVNRRSKAVSLHFISDQGTLIVSLTPAQARCLKDKLNEKELDGK